MVAIWVNLDKRHALVMLTFAVVESLIVDQIPTSDLIALIAFCQFISSLSSFPVI